MSSERRTTRRRFVVLTGLSLAGLAGVGGVRLFWGGPKEVLTERVGAVLDGDAVRGVGRAYLEARPHDDDEVRLVRLLETRREWRLVKSSRDVAHAMSTASLDDFRFGRTVSVRGWHLSETEARACALATFA